MAGPMGDDKVNMIPLIDCMFFLILFFMIVTKFTPDEKAITSLLPTNKGQSTGASSAVKTEQVNILVYPSGLGKGFQPSEYKKQIETTYADGSFNRKAELRIGTSKGVEIDGATLAQYKDSSASMVGTIEAFHEYVFQEMQSREQEGKSRKDQFPVVIHCYSQLSWKYALLAYDAVRAYEAKKTGHINIDSFQIQEAREVSFAPPRIRNYNFNELGNELYEIVNMK